MRVSGINPHSKTNAQDFVEIENLVENFFTRMTEKTEGKAPEAKADFFLTNESEKNQKNENI